MKNYAPEFTIQRKKVFRNSEIDHIWAQQKLSEGRNPQGNVYFNGPSIFSYGSHFEMARFISADIVLITTRNYSPTTARHMQGVRHAITHKTVYEVPSFTDHNVNAEYFIKSIADGVNSILKGRTSFSFRLDLLRESKLEAQTFLTAFKKEIKKELRTKLSKAIKKEYFTEKQLKEFKVKEKRNDESVARGKITREKNDEIRREKRTLEWRERQRVLDADLAFDFALADIREHEIEKLTDEALTVWESEIEALTRKAWRNGDTRADEFISYDAPIMLRVRDGEIETSRGAYVPMDEARILWALLKAKKPVHGVTIGHYTVKGVIDNQLVIGCHQIPCREVARMAVTLGLESEAA